MSIRRSLPSIGKVIAIVATGLLLASCNTVAPTIPGRASGDEKRFHTTVKPLLEKRCVWCHSNEKPQGGLNFQDRSGVLSSPRRFIVPGSADKSLIFRALTLDSNHPKVMPGDGWGITAEQEAEIRKWIESGAPWPEGRRGRIQRQGYQVDFDDYL